MSWSVEEIKRDALNWTRSDVEWIRSRIERGDLESARSAAGSAAAILNVCAVVARHHKSVPYPSGRAAAQQQGGGGVYGLAAL